MGTYFSTPCGEKSHREGACFTCDMNEDLCKEPFVKWKKCVKQAKRKKQDIVNTCFHETSELKDCLEANKERYGELFEAEKNYGIRFLGYLKRTGQFKEGDIEKLEEQFPAIELVFNLQAYREAEKIRRGKSNWSGWFWGN